MFLVRLRLITMARAGVILPLVLHAFAFCGARGRVDFTGYNIAMYERWSSQCGSFWECTDAFGSIVLLVFFCTFGFVIEGGMCSKMRIQFRRWLTAFTSVGAGWLLRGGYAWTYWTGLAVVACFPALRSTRVRPSALAIKQSARGRPRWIWSNQRALPVRSFSGFLPRLKSALILWCRVA